MQISLTLVSTENEYGEKVETASVFELAHAIFLVSTLNTKSSLLFMHFVYFYFLKEEKYGFLRTK